MKRASAIRQLIFSVVAFVALTGTTIWIATPDPAFVGGIEAAREEALITGVMYAGLGVVGVVIHFLATDTSTRRGVNRVRLRTNRRRRWGVGWKLRRAEKRLVKLQRDLNESLKAIADVDHSFTDGAERTAKRVDMRVVKGGRHA